MSSDNLTPEAIAKWKRAHSEALFSIIDAQARRVAELKLDAEKLRARVAEIERKNADLLERQVPNQYRLVHEQFLAQLKERDFPPPSGYATAEQARDAVAALTRTLTGDTRTGAVLALNAIGDILIGTKASPEPEGSHYDNVSDNPDLRGRETVGGK